LLRWIIGYNVATEAQHGPLRIAVTTLRFEFESAEQFLPGEWMWVRVHHCAEKRQLVFGTLDNEPVVNSEDLQLCKELAISFGKVREHRKGSRILR
jgi:hypothetical protein